MILIPLGTSSKNRPNIISATTLYVSTFGICVLFVNIALFGKFDQVLKRLNKNYLFPNLQNCRLQYILNLKNPRQSVKFLKVFALEGPDVNRLTLSSFNSLTIIV